MRSPTSLLAQRIARGRGELLRGCGIWPSFGFSVGLEPPFEPFDWSTISCWDLCVHGCHAPYQGLFMDKLKRWFRPIPMPQGALYEDGPVRSTPLWVTTVAHYADDEVSLPKAEQLILALGPAHDLITFELFGCGQSPESEARIEVRFLANERDVPLLESQLHSLYPRSAVVSHEYGTDDDSAWDDKVRGWKDEQEPLHIVPLFLKEFYCFPIRTYSHFGTDPLGTAVAVLDELNANEWGLVQVSFGRARHPWAENLKYACQEPYRDGEFWVSGLDRRLLAEKLSHPLYAVAVHVASNQERVLTRLGALVHQYESPHNQLALRDAAAWAGQWDDNAFPDLADWRDILCERSPLAPGILLNAAELAGLVHLPSPDLPSERLLRVKSQTRPAPKVDSKAWLVLGQNTHRGKVRQVAMPPDLRARHCYIAGASGTGKSTLLLNMILQDVRAGRGVGLLDPHGDLVKAVLRHLPESRLDDVILFDAADTEYPFALNILDAHDEAERERIVAETIMALERYFPASWGPRLERILQYTLRTVLHAVPGATLSDVERMLTDEEYRETVLGKTTDARMLQFWRTQFKYLPRNATDPVLNKLSVFLMDRNVRNITCQRHAAVNFDDVLNQGKILLANLSTGLLTEKVAGTLGSFLVTKIVNAAFRRASLPESQRRPWFLYVDEFQAFMNLSVGFERILAESRKYKLVLAGLANQYVGQISPAVRQAIFGNVGTLISFRLGLEDANALAKELGVFTTEDLLNLDVGQAIARAGGSSTAFNLQTFPPPAPPENDPTSRVVANSRTRYAKARSIVEKDLRDVGKSVESREAPMDFSDEPSDPNEDDLVI